MTIENAAKQLTPKQRQAIPLLASGMAGKNVAIAINCNAATVSQWINHDQQFQKALGVFSEGSLHLAQVQLESLSVMATEQLRELLVNAKSESARLKAIELTLAAVGLGGGTAKGLKKGQKGKDELYETDSTQYDLNKLLEGLGGK